MSVRKIKLNQITDVKEFVSVAGKCDFDIDVFYNRISIDAKSIMGVLSLDLSQVLTVKYGGQDAQFENILNKYSAA
ncbi:MAG: HPr family phosphocarrier protein [Eubacteriales bacterium]|nr:HPr family phosphocarrier protein [Eubacteriales bacterium]